MIHDNRGHRLTGATSASAAAYESALHQFSLYSGDPVATVQGAIDEGPEFVMAQALKAYLHLLGTEPAGVPVARDARKSSDTGAVRLCLRL
jgi:hypothetical protein